jgi:hypothetical protein
MILCQRVNRNPAPNSLSVLIQTSVDNMITPNSSLGAIYGLATEQFRGLLPTTTVGEFVRLLSGVMEDAVMSDLYVDRIADLRRRFATGLDARIDSIETAIPHSGNVSPDVLEQAHRDAHNLCGIGATLGYFNTGTAARPVEQILLAAVKARRTHTTDESLRLRAAITLLRSTAAAEIIAGSQ